MDPVSAESAFDELNLMECVDGDADLADEIVRLFIHEEPGMSDLLRRAVDGGHALEIGRAAHSFKGVLASIGAARAAGAAARIEAAAEGGKPVDNASVTRFLDGEVAAVVTALGSYLQRRAAA